MKAEELRSWWAVEWHPKGAFSVLPLWEVLERNYRHCMEGVKRGQILLGLFPNMESGLEAVRKLKRRKRELLQKGAKKGGEYGGSEIDGADVEGV